MMIGQSALLVLNSTLVLAKAFMTKKKNQTHKNWHKRDEALIHRQLFMAFKPTDVHLLVENKTVKKDEGKAKTGMTKIVDK